MNKIKKGLIMALAVGVLMMGSVFGAAATATATAPETATLNITTIVGQTTVNTGIRITGEEIPDYLTPANFDNAFFPMGSVVDLGDSNAVTGEATGKFSVLVRKPSPAPIKVSVTAFKLKSGENEIKYKLEKNGTLFIADYTEKPATKTYNTTAAVDSVIRDHSKFEYKTTNAMSSASGTYTATITFNITIQ